MSDPIANKLEPNQQALRWLKAARAQALPHLLYVLQLAHWGLEKGVLLQSGSRSRGVLQESLEQQVGLLLAAKDQARAWLWLVQNPDGPEMPEQISTLSSALQRSRNPLQAAAAVLETVSSRMEAASATTQE